MTTRGSCVSQYTYMCVWQQYTFVASVIKDKNVNFFSGNTAGLNEGEELLKATSMVLTVFKWEQTKKHASPE